MAASKRIIIVDNSVAVTGALRSITFAATQLRDEFDFVFVLPEGSTALEMVTGKGFKVHQLPFVEIAKRPKNLILYFPYLVLNSFRLKKIVKENNGGIVHMNDFYNMVGLMAKGLGAPIKVVTHVRFLPQKFIPFLSKIWARLNLFGANQIVCNSQAVRSFFPDNDKVAVIYNAVPVTETHPPKEVTNSADETIRLFYLGNFIRGKGQDHALKAFKKAYVQNNRLRLYFAGGDMGLEKNRAFREELEAEVRESGLTGIVHFDSFIHDVEKEIKKADIMLNFSESESFSLTCLAAHYPFVCSEEITSSVIEHEARSLNHVNADKAAASLNLIMENLDQEAVFQKPEYRSQYLKYKGGRNMLLALYYAIAKKKGTAFHYLKLAIKFNPGFLKSRRFMAVAKKLVIG